MTSNWLTTTWVALFAFLIAMSACGDDESRNNGKLSIPGATPVSSVPVGAPLIDQDKLTFLPSELSVSAGTTVYLKNSENAVHTVTIEGKNVSGVMRQGDMLAWLPPSPGAYRVTCDYHPKMLATITVE